MKRLIFHVDVNSAFLSWEAVRQVREGKPDPRLVPAVIGGDPKKRHGIVLAKSIPAGKCGIRTGEPMALALKKCPGLISYPADFRQYDICSKAFKSICGSYAPVMQSMSIDEVFLDMTGTGWIYPDPVALAYEIKDRIRKELGFTVNIGIGENRLCAKMAGDFEKPDRVHTLFREEIPEKMWPLPVGDLLTVGSRSAARLNGFGIETIGELAQADLKMVQKAVGLKAGQQFQAFALGMDDTPVRAVPEEARGYSVETTVEEDLETLESIEPLLLAQADLAAARMRRDHARCFCVSVSWRTTDFRNHSHQRKLPESTDVTTEIYETARQLIRESWNQEPLRLLGVALSEVDRGDYEQLCLFEDARREKQRSADRVVDAIRGKYGNGSIQRAGTLGQSARIGRKYKAGEANEIEKERRK